MQPDPPPVNPSGDIERPFWGEANFTREYESFSPQQLATGTVADVNILALLNSDTARFDDLFPTDFPYNQGFPADPSSDPIFDNWLDQIHTMRDMRNIGEAQITTVHQFIENITYFIENGLQVPDKVVDDPDNPGNPLPVYKTLYFTPELAGAIDLVVTSLKAAGWDQTLDPASPTDQQTLIDALQRWLSTGENRDTFDHLRNLTGYIERNDNIIPIDEQVGYAAQSLQRMLEIGYVQQGTEIVFNDLQLLKDRQTIAKDALTLLARIQNLHNEILPEQIEAVGDRMVFTETEQHYFVTRDEYDDFLADLAGLEEGVDYKLANPGIPELWQGLLAAAGLPIEFSDPSDLLTSAEIQNLWDTQLDAIEYQFTNGNHSILEMINNIQGRLVYDSDDQFTISAANFAGYLFEYVTLPEITGDLSDIQGENVKDHLIGLGPSLHISDFLINRLDIDTSETLSVRFPSLPPERIFPIYWNFITHEDLIGAQAVGPDPSQNTQIFLTNPFQFDYGNGRPIPPLFASQFVSGAQNLDDFLNNQSNIDSQQFLEKWNVVLENNFRPPQVVPGIGLDGAGNPIEPADWVERFTRYREDLGEIIAQLQEERLDSTREEIAALNAELDPADQIPLPGSIEDIANLQPPLNIQFGAKGGSLEATLQTIYNDMDPGTDAATAVRNWIVDGYPNDELGTNGLNNRGAFQDNLRSAITAGANLNDELKAGLRKSLFIFEEFYKSATALLSKISTLTEKIVSNASQ